MKVWIIASVVLVLLIGGFFAVSAFQSSGDVVAKTGCGKCNGSCTAESNCGLAGCGAVNGGECACNKTGSCGGSCTTGNTCGSSGCAAAQGTGSCGCGK